MTTIYKTSNPGELINHDDLYEQDADAVIVTTGNRQMRIVRLRGTARVGKYESMCPLTFEPITLEDQHLEDAHVFTRTEDWDRWELMGTITNIVPTSVSNHAAFDAANILGNLT